MKKASGSIECTKNFPRGYALFVTFSRGKIFSTFIFFACECLELFWGHMSSFYPSEVAWIAERLVSTGCPTYVSLSSSNHLHEKNLFKPNELVSLEAMQEEAAKHNLYWAYKSFSTRKYCKSTIIAWKKNSGHFFHAKVLHAMVVQIICFNLPF